MDRAIPHNSSDVVDPIGGYSIPGPRRSGRTRMATETCDADAQSSCHATRTMSKRKRPSANDIVTADPSQETSYAQEVVTASSSKTTRKRVASKQLSKSDVADAKLTTKSRPRGPSKDAGNLIDLTGDEDAAPKSKKPKKSKSEKGEEKRLRKYRTQAPQKYAAVVHRATTQRMVVIDRRRANSNDCSHHASRCMSEEVDLAGSTGNVYTVKITHVPECTCPDFRINRNPQCKHILYVLLKILKVLEPLNYQAAFLTSELDEIFDRAGPLPTETIQTEDKDGKRKPVEGDCPICCEELSQQAEAIVWCQAACGNNLHKTCFDQWAATKGYGQVTCPYCRTQWQSTVDGGTLKGMAKTGQKNRDGYVNVADQVGMSTRRDYSTYHDYWVRAQLRDGLLDDGGYDLDYEDDDY
ncbi:hypothetical protein E4T42_03276 [Aureobasidium subglaciale]|nr:hypothetical protein E4T42_03276 [Aureobasidium subglaciale]